MAGGTLTPAPKGPWFGEELVLSPGAVDLDEDLSAELGCPLSPGVVDSSIRGGVFGSSRRHPNTSGHTPLHPPPPAGFWNDENQQPAQRYGTHEQVTTGFWASPVKGRQQGFSVLHAPGEECSSSGGDGLFSVGPVDSEFEGYSGGHPQEQRMMEIQRRRSDDRDTEDDDDDDDDDGRSSHADAGYHHGPRCGAAIDQKLSLDDQNFIANNGDDDDGQSCPTDPYQQLAPHPLSSSENSCRLPSVRIRNPVPGESPLPHSPEVRNRLPRAAAINLSMQEVQAVPSSHPVDIGVEDTHRYGGRGNNNDDDEENRVLMANVSRCQHINRKDAIHPNPQFAPPRDHPHLLGNSNGVQGGRRALPVDNWQRPCAGGEIPEFGFAPLDGPRAAHQSSLSGGEDDSRVIGYFGSQQGEIPGKKGRFRRPAVGDLMVDDEDEGGDGAEQSVSELHSDYANGSDDDEDGCADYKSDGLPTTGRGARRKSVEQSVEMLDNDGNDNEDVIALRPPHEIVSSGVEDTAGGEGGIPAVLNGRRRSSAARRVAAKSRIGGSQRDLAAMRRAGRDLPGARSDSDSHSAGVAGEGVEAEESSRRHGGGNEKRVISSSPSLMQTPTEGDDHALTVAQSLRTAAAVAAQRSAAATAAGGIHAEEGWRGGGGAGDEPPTPPVHLPHRSQRAARRRESVAMYGGGLTPDEGFAGGGYSGRGDDRDDNDVCDVDDDVDRVGGSVNGGDAVSSKVMAAASSSSGGVSKVGGGVQKLTAAGGVALEIVGLNDSGGQVMKQGTKMKNVLRLKRNEMVRAGKGLVDSSDSEEPPSADVLVASVAKESITEREIRRDNEVDSEVVGVPDKRAKGATSRKGLPVAVERHQERGGREYPQNEMNMESMCNDDDDDHNVGSMDYDDGDANAYGGEGSGGSSPWATPIPVLASASGPEEQPAGKQPAGGAVGSKHKKKSTKEEAPRAAQPAEDLDHEPEAVDFGGEADECAHNYDNDGEGEAAEEGEAMRANRRRGSEAIEVAVVARGGRGRGAAAPKGGNRNGNVRKAASEKAVARKPRAAMKKVDSRGSGGGLFGETYDYRKLKRMSISAVAFQQAAKEGDADEKKTSNGDANDDASFGTRGYQRPQRRRIPVLKWWCNEGYEYHRGKDDVGPTIVGVYRRRSSIGPTVVEGLDESSTDSDGGSQNGMADGEKKVAARGIAGSSEKRKKSANRGRSSKADEEDRNRSLAAGGARRGSGGADGRKRASSGTTDGESDEGATGGSASKKRRVSDNSVSADSSGGRGAAGRGRSGTRRDEDHENAVEQKKRSGGSARKSASSGGRGKSGSATGTGRGRSGSRDVAGGEDVGAKKRKITGNSRGDASDGNVGKASKKRGRASDDLREDNDIDDASSHRQKSDSGRRSRSESVGGARRKKDDATVSKTSSSRKSAGSERRETGKSGRGNGESTAGAAMTPVASNHEIEKLVTTAYAADRDDIRLVSRASDFEWKEIGNAESKYYSCALTFECDAFTVCELKLPPDTSKGIDITGDYTFYYSVMGCQERSVLVELLEPVEEVIRVSTDDRFIVPAGVSYNISNLSSSVTAHLHVYITPANLT